MQILCGCACVSFSAWFPFILTNLIPWTFGTSSPFADIAHISDEMSLNLQWNQLMIVRQVPKSALIAASFMQQLCSLFFCSQGMNHVAVNALSGAKSCLHAGCDIVKAPSLWLMSCLHAVSWQCGLTEPRVIADAFSTTKCHFLWLYSGYNLHLFYFPQNLLIWDFLSLRLTCNGNIIIRVWIHFNLL